MTVDEWVTLIGAVAAAVVTIMNGVRFGRKLETIHKDTNGNLRKVETQVSYLKDLLSVSRSS